MYQHLPPKKVYHCSLKILSGCFSQAIWRQLVINTVYIFIYIYIQLKPPSIFMTASHVCHVQKELKILCTVDHLPINESNRQGVMRQDPFWNADFLDYHNRNRPPTPKKNHCMGIICCILSPRNYWHPFTTFFDFGLPWTSLTENLWNLLPFTRFFTCADCSIEGKYLEFSSRF